MPHRYVARKMVWFWGFLARHNTLTTLAVVAIVAVPGYLSLQSQADENTHQGNCNTQAWSLIAALITADNGPWAATHVVLSQEANEQDYKTLRHAVNLRYALSDNFTRALTKAAAECGQPVPLPIDIPKVLTTPSPAPGSGHRANAP
jgi:hypothetical protein